MNPQFPVEANRYHLYISYACPWSVYTLQVLKIKGLDNSISYSATLPEWGILDEYKTKGWIFERDVSSERSGQIGKAEYIDPLFGSSNVKDLYQRSSPEHSGLYMLPILWDKQTNQIVNNESSEIVRMFNTNFNNLA